MRVALVYGTRPPPRCLVCGVELARRWWQRGLFAPIPLCSWRPDVAAACRDRAGR